MGPIKPGSCAICILLAGLLLPACDTVSKTKRWYTSEQVAAGAEVFANNCASCHGSRAEGVVKEWKIRRPDGSYPPPPLNGSAHAWHHPLPLLTEIVQKGGALYNGKMPGFGDSLSKDEQLAAIAWFQSLWSDETYRIWSSNQQQTRNKK